MTRSHARLLTTAALLAVLALPGVGRADAAWSVALAVGGSTLSASAPLPQAPAGVAAACRSANQAKVQVSWSAVAPVTSYTVYGSTTSATSGFTVKATGVTGTTWTSGNVANGTYWWRVSATVGTSWTGAASATSGSTTIRSTGTTCSVP